MLYRITFRKTEDQHLRLIAHADKGQDAYGALFAVYPDPAVFNTALGLAGVSTSMESQLAVAAEKAWREPLIDVCCEPADLMDGQLETLNLRARDN